MPRILLADDDAAMRSFLTVALEKAGHDICVCKDGLEALEKLNSKPPFDLLLTDIVMPGMDGVELAEAAKALFPDLKILFMTGFSGIAAEKSMGKNGPSDGGARLMSKPFHLLDLIKQVNDLLGL